MLILVEKENEQDEVHIFQGTYFESSQIHHLIIVYRFKHINHDNPLVFFSQTLFKLFLHACNLHQQNLPCLSGCKNHPFHVMMFH